MPDITAHMVVKNEDRWVWFAIMSTLPYVTRFLITDTGSSDETIRVINSIKSDKIELSRASIGSASELTQIRQAQLEATKTDWFWIVDGDEIYPQATSKEILQAVEQGSYEGIVVRRHDLLGDVYHRQRESVGRYQLFGQTGHLVTRLINQAKIKGLHYQGDYPLEGFYDQDRRSTRERNPRHWYITKSYLYHTMYLPRSSQGANLKSVLHRHKYKHELGVAVPTALPEVFAETYPSFVPNPLTRRSPLYTFSSALITPLKIIKRKIMG